VKPWLFFLALAFAGTAVAISANVTLPEGTVTIALPSDASPALRPGPGVEAVQRYCVRCHSSAYVAIQPSLTAAQWTAEVTKMRRVFGASIPDDAAATIVQYLTVEYGKP
jgi:sulfite dehydrogenase (cytochrome) subunit B